VKDIYWNSTMLDMEKEEKEVKNSHGSGPGGANSNNSNNVVEVFNNKIFYYSVVDRGRILKLNKAILSLGVMISHRSLHLDVEAPPIKLHINSYGGSVFSGFAAVDYILQSKVPVHTIIDGCAASAATIMSVVGTKRYMHRNAYMLIHQLSSGMWGNYRQLVDEMENCDILMERIKEIYRRHTKIPKKQLDEMLKHDLWWDAETCLKYGLIDEII
jgi:ATP-dependent Clp endopeptidase proteolytic subunit ClpP